MSSEPNLLVVDDQPANLALLTGLLRARGYRIRPVPSGPLALQAAELSPPDLVLLDISMPEMDGFEVCRRLKADPKLKPIPVIFLSAHGSTEDKVEGFRCGGVDFITKPFQVDEVEARVRLHLSLARLHRELAAANQELDLYAQTAAHDLRTPLHQALGFLDLIQERGDGLDAKTKTYLENVVAAILQMERLVGDLLAFAKSGRSPLHAEAVDLEFMVRDVVEQLEPQTRDRSIRWEVGALPPVTGDPTLLRLVLQNLLTNAVKFTRGQPEARIGIHALEGEPGFRVQDNGVGFDPAQAHRLFAPFQRLHASSDFEGTGLGLANVERIVRRHGGRVWAVGAPGAGATFHVALPSREPAPAPAGGGTDHEG